MNTKNLDPATFSKLLGVVSDVSLIIDSQGVIEDVSTAQDTMATLGCQAWMGKRWTDTVTVESKKKIQEPSLDDILEKIQIDGINALTSQEKKLLDDYSHGK